MLLLLLVSFRFLSFSPTFNEVYDLYYTIINRLINRLNLIIFFNNFFLIFLVFTFLYTSFVTDCKAPKQVYQLSSGLDVCYNLQNDFQNCGAVSRIYLPSQLPIIPQFHSKQQNKKIWMNLLIYIFFFFLLHLCFVSCRLSFSFCYLGWTYLSCTSTKYNTNLCKCSMWSR